MQGGERELYGWFISTYVGEHEVFIFLCLAQTQNDFFHFVTNDRKSFCLWLNSFMFSLFMHWVHWFYIIAIVNSAT